MSRRSLCLAVAAVSGLLIPAGIYLSLGPVTRGHSNVAGGGNHDSRSEQPFQKEAASPRTIQGTLKRTAPNGEVVGSPDSAEQWRSAKGYSGSHACRQCHPAHDESYHQTAHSRALSEVAPEFEPPDAVFDHAASGRRYRVARSNGELFHEESLPLDDGTELLLTSAPVRYRVGSGHHARTYLCDASDNFLLESPITWYESAKEWGMTPGFDKPTHRAFSRQILENCLWCHAGQIQTSMASTMRLRVIESAIGCERCHGPGQGHVDSQLAGHSAADTAERSIVNPRRLQRQLADAVCQQCHLQGDIQIGGRRARATDFRPGKPLEKFATIYRVRRPERGMTVVGHVEQLRESSCYRRSDSLTCLSCHNPHRPVLPEGRADHYRSICLSCHKDPGCRLPLAARQETSQNNCIHCHMPKSATEVPHLAFTHHHIGIHPLRDNATDKDVADPLLPLSDLSVLPEFDRVRSLMLARIELFLLRGLDYQQSKSGQELVEQIDKWRKELSTDESDVEIEFAGMQFSLARGDLGGALRSANRALGFDDIRTEEEAAVLGQLGQLEFREGNFEKAQLRFEKLTRLRCNGHDWFYLGQCQIKRGQTDQALESLGRARQLAPGDLQISDTLVGLYHRLGQVAAERNERSRLDLLRAARHRSNATIRAR